jgi:peptide/nickel transport system substrate-binding protein
MRTFRKKGVTRTQIVAAIIVVVIIIVAGTVLATRHAPTTPPPTTTTPPSTPTSTSTSSSAYTTTSSTTTTSRAMSNTTLSIDDYYWPIDNLNELYAEQFVPWPDWLEGAVYQTLVAVNLSAEQNYGKLQFLPDLATGWNTSTNGEVYTFYLRHNVTFSDGNPFNAYDVWTEFYFWYYLTGNSTTFWNGLNIFNTGNVNVGPATFALINQSGLSNPSPQLLSIMGNTNLPAYVTGPYAIVFHLAVPFPFFVNTFTGFEGMIFDPMYVLQHGGPGQPGSINSYFNTNPIPGTGPYTVTSVQMDEYVEFQQNPNYWAKSLTPSQIAANPILDPGHYKTIIVYFKSSDTTRYIDLTTGKVQLAAVTSSDFQLILNNPSYGYAVIKYPADMVSLDFNNNIFPTNVTDVRLAIVHAINYTQVIDQAVFGYGKRVMGPETPNYGQFYDPGNYPPYSYNLTEAKQYLAEAGFPGGKGLPPLTLEVDALGTSWETPAAEIIQQDLAQIGITVNIQVVPDSVFYSPFGSYQTNLQDASQIPPLSFNAVDGYAPDYLAPTDFWTSFVTNMSPWGNWGAYNNPTVDSAVLFMDHSNNLSAIMQKLTVAQGVIYNQAPYDWLFAAQLPLIDGSYAYNKQTISGFYMDPNLVGVTDLPILNTITPA